jgi:putative acetyltransferase
MAYTIRPFKEADAPALTELTQAAIRVIGRKAYSAEQVAAWAARQAGHEWFAKRARNGAWISVAAAVEDRPVGYAVLEMADTATAHLDMLYCHPDHTRRGLAAQLLIDAEQEALRRGARRIASEASDLARPAFERAGYAVLNRRDFLIAHDGRDVPIHNYAMEKKLG